MELLTITDNDSHGDYHNEYDYPYTERLHEAKESEITPTHSNIPTGKPLPYASDVTQHDTLIGTDNDTEEKYKDGLDYPYTEKLDKI